MRRRALEGADAEGDDRSRAETRPWRRLERGRQGGQRSEMAVRGGEQRCRSAERETTVVGGAPLNFLAGAKELARAGAAVLSFLPVALSLLLPLGCRPPQRAFLH